MMRLKLLWKLLALNATGIIFVLAAVWLSIEFHASNYFMTLMKDFDLDAPEVNDMFLWANRRSLIQVAVVTGIIIALLSLWMTRRFLAPLRAMNTGTERIAEGDYGYRVKVESNDELGNLVVAFNRMAESLMHMDQLRKSMVVDVAHELRTPLTNLRGYIEALQDGLVKPVPVGSKNSADDRQASKIHERIPRHKIIYTLADLHFEPLLEHLPSPIGWPHLRSG